MSLRGVKAIDRRQQQSQIHNRVSIEPVFEPWHRRHPRTIELLGVLSIIKVSVREVLQFALCALQLPQRGLQLRRSGPEGRAAESMCLHSAHENAEGIDVDTDRVATQH